MVKAREQHNLTAKQHHILVLLYKFRFITIPQLTIYKNLKTNSLQRTFDILIKQKYVDRKYNSTYKMDRKPATYYLTAKGISILKDDDRFNANTLHSYYKNKSLSQETIDHNIATLTVYNHLRFFYKDKYTIFTKQEIMHFDDMPENKPDIYLRGNNEYFLILAHDTQPYLTRKRLLEYITHSEDEGWNGAKYPGLLFVLKNSIDEKRFIEFAKNSLESTGIDYDELRISTTTIKAITKIQYISAIWTFIDDSANKLTSLA